MKMARRGQVVQMRFFPLEVTDTVDFPEGHVMVVCNSGVSARKSAGAKDVFNQRVACYHIGRELFKRANPAAGVRYLRDMLPAALGIAEREILARFEDLPESASRDELRAMLGAETLEPYFGTHGEDTGRYRIRGVMTFGLAECERSRRAAELLRERKYAAFGELMNISQAGERVDDSGETEGPLGKIPGSYGCSIPEIDRMWSIANRVEGVLGAQISGAGLGGCLMVLAREEAVELVRETLVRDYYGPAGIPAEVFACYPSAGSGVLLEEWGVVADFNYQLAISN